MKIPIIRGVIDRRMLINFTADPQAVEKIVPSPFRPKIYKGKAIVGICLIRLKEVRPKGLPSWIGVSSENGAHRIAVEWDENSQVKEGVFIPRRDTSLMLNTLLGGRLFPGKHHRAKFHVVEQGSDYHIDFTSEDHTQIAIDAKETTHLNPDSIFGSMENVSDFFEKGAIGYSPNQQKFDGLKLKAYTWKVRPLTVSHVKSSFFEDEKIFPKGSIHFDNALLMTNIEHEWQSETDKFPLQPLC